MGESARGSCLCGLVTFEVKGPFRKFHWCHCSRCRKASGSAHAANIFTQPENINWLTGGDLVRHYRRSGARAFSKCFCSNCGSPLPYLNSSRQYLVIPAGGLDQDPGIRPDDHIFWCDRAPWYDAGVSAARFDGYPD